MTRTLSLVPRRRELTVLDRVRAALRSFWTGEINFKDPELAKVYASLFGGGAESYTGIQVTRDNAFTFSAVFDAVNQISSDVAKLPLNLHKRRKEGGSDLYEDSPLYWLLKHEASAEMTSMVFRRTLVAHALTCHGGYAEIERDRLERPIALHLLTPDRVEPIRRKTTVDGREQLGPLVYRIDSNDDTILDARNVLHIHGLGYDGFLGYEIIHKARQTIGLALAAEKFGAQYFGKGTVFGGWLETEDDLDEPQKEDIRQNIEKFRAAQDSAWRILVTGANHKFHQFTSNSKDAQLDESRVSQVEEVARFFRMPPVRLGVNRPGTVSYASVESSNLDYYTGALLDWITNVEQEFNRKLIPRLERRQQFIKHNARAFLRTSFKEQNEALGIARDKGIINADEWRELLDMNPQDGGQGKLYLVQSAQVPLNKISAIADAAIEAQKAKSAPPAQPPAAPPADSDREDPLITDLQRRLGQAEALVEEARQARAALSEQLAAAQADSTTKADAIVALRASELKQQEIAASMTAIVAGLRTELEAALEAKAAAASERAAAEAERQATRDREASVVAERDQLAAEADRLRVAAAEAAARADAVGADREASESARADAQAQAAAARQQADAAEEARHLAEAQVLEAQQARVDAERRLADFEARTATETAARDEAERASAAELSRIAGELAAAASREQQARADADTLSRTCEDLRQQIAALDAARLTRDGDVQQLRDALTTIEREREAAREQLDVATREREQAAAHEASLLAAAQARAEQAEAERTRVQAELQAATEATRARRIATIAAHRALVVDAMGRMVRREAEQARKKQTTAEKLRRWLDGFPTLHEAICVEALLPAIRVHLAWRSGTSDPIALTTTLVREHLALFDRRLRAVLESDAGEFHAELDRMLTRWESERPAAVADALLIEEVQDAVDQ